MFTNFIFIFRFITIGNWWGGHHKVSSIVKLNHRLMDLDTSWDIINPVNDNNLSYFLFTTKFKI